MSTGHTRQAKDEGMMCRFIPADDVLVVSNTVALPSFSVVFIKAKQKPPCVARLNWYGVANK